MRAEGILIRSFWPFVYSVQNGHCHAIIKMHLKVTVQQPRSRTSHLVPQDHLYHSCELCQEGITVGWVD
ncbi:hypothetical protein N7468_007759 [Penicillium chermesinum]|uniref:Uncharacterized protein n=1 Tax=Penicillium chermesinum TaxID=63820 RepID=A0A9W9TL44_9EURO|nr:uncharacterized protein N7468_007759 [Penicillium chermesinum]KAJ5226534.1 hypothetical protein N7468_007759 [Penicillium chermesinum]